MREIRFRLIKNGEIVGYEQHTLYPRVENDRSFDVVIIEHTEVLDIVWFEVGDSFCIPHDSKDQYIGIEDKGNKKIYERDITENIYGRRGVVLWDKNKMCYCWKDICCGAIRIIDFKSFLEILGNVYEHPKLLEAKNADSK